MKYILFGLAFSASITGTVDFFTDGDDPLPKFALALASLALYRAERIGERLEVPDAD